MDGRVFDFPQVGEEEGKDPRAFMTVEDIRGVPDHRATEHGVQQGRRAKMWCNHLVGSGVVAGAPPAFDEVLEEQNPCCGMAP